MKKIVALLLCLVIVFSFPASALATEIASAQSASGVNEKTEVVSMRDTYSKTYLLPDGSYQYVAYAEPVHYKDSTDAFVEINNAIKESDTRAGYKYTNTSNSWNAFFAEKLNSDDAVLITDEDYTVSFTFPGQTGLGTAANSSTLSKLSSSKYYEKIAADNRTVIYQNVVANVDIVYTVQHSVLKEDIVLKSKAAPNTFKFRLNTNGLTVDEKDGTIALFDSKGNEIFAFAPLYMEDSNGKRSENVQLTCESIKNGYEITISADAAFLNAADTVYPVVVDPSIMVTGYDVTFDTCVDQEYPTSNYYLSENLWTGGALGTNAMRTYMKYTLPTGIYASQVTSAYVYLLKKEHQVPTIKAYRVTSDWSSSAITWNNKPSYTTTYASAVATNTVGNWYGLNVTTMVKNWLNGTYSNYGMVLKEPSESNSAQKTKFYSSDAPSPNKPELVINYDAPTIAVELRYDQAYANRFSGTSARISRETNVLKTKYATEFGINVNLYTPNSFYSYADSYCTTDPFTYCRHPDDHTCANSSTSVLQSYHHTNIFNILCRVTRPNTSENVKIAFIGHNNCEVSGINHYSNPYYGLCYYNLGLMGIMNFVSEAQETKTLVHEFGHLYFVEDHYGGNTRTTEQMIQETGNTGYSRNCIYGENKDQASVYNNLVICDGCASVIIANKNRFSH